MVKVVRDGSRGRDLRKRVWRRQDRADLFVPSSVLCLLVVVWLSRGTKAAKDTTAITWTTSCTSEQYFDTTALDCGTCATAQDTSGKRLKQPYLMAVDEDSVCSLERFTLSQEARGDTLLMPESGAWRGDEYGNSLVCGCPAGSVVQDDSADCDLEVDGSCTAFSCASCAANVSYTDRSACTTCGGVSLFNGSAPIGYSASLGDCECDFPNEVLVEEDQGGNKLVNKTCLSCAPGTLVFFTGSDSATTVAGRDYYSDLYTCQRCPDPHMSMSYDASSAQYSCSCGSDYTSAGADAVGELYCVLTDELPAVTANSYTYTFNGVDGSAAGAGGDVQVDSITLEHFFPRAAASCEYWGGSEDLDDCQTLGNLCVLQIYDPNSEACTLYSSLVEERDSLNARGWSETLPWLLYTGTSDALNILEDEITTTTYSFSTDSTDFRDQITLIASVFTLNGTWLGYESVDTLFSYCAMEAPNTAKGGGTNSDSTYLRFGWSTHTRSRCELSTLLDQEQLFYDLFLVESDGVTLVPVPVRIKNYRTAAGARVNDNPSDDDVSDDVLVRRFFLFDRWLGLESSATDDTPTVLRYAKTIDLEVKIQDEDPQLIYPPVLTIRYAEVASEDVLESGSDFRRADVTVTTRYTMDTSSFWNTASGLFIFLIIVTIMLTGLRVHNWRKRNDRMAQAQRTGEMGALNWEFCRVAGSLALHSYVLVFFPFTFILCSYWFTFYKMQSTVKVVLPPAGNFRDGSSEYAPFVATIHLLFFFQLAWVLNLIYAQCRADIFFLDWEKPSNKSTGKVSVWRSIMVANEWNELQTTRKTSLLFSLAWMAFFLIGLNLQYNATERPTLGDTSPGDINPVLRFANTTWFWLVVAAAQIVWKVVLYERYISEPPEQLFIDMCTIAKVSVVILYENYYGFYLHCRSPYPIADGTMMELLELLDKEEYGFTTNRGLEGAPEDAQSFELFVTDVFRRKYDKLYASLLAPTEVGGRARRRGRERAARAAGVGRQGGSPGPGQRGGAMAADGTSGNPRDTMNAIQAYQDITQFLQNFIEENYTRTELRREIRANQDMWTKLFRIPPDMTASSIPSVFVPDTTSQFTTVTFLGRELDLWLLDVLTFAISDVWFDNTAVSILLTYLMSLLVVSLRDTFGRANVAGKTLVDERFLV